MSNLTPKQEKFCQEYIKTGNASEAYRRAYDTKKSKESTINRRAKELLDDGKITARLKELQQPAIEKAEMTLERHLNDLKAIRNAAFKDKRFSAAAQAEIARGRAAGFYVTKVDVQAEVATTELTKDEFKEYSQELLKEFIGGKET